MINELTEAQVAAIPAHRDRWLHIGLSTERVDHAQAKAAVSLAYECAGLKPPSKWVFLPDPMQGAIAVAQVSDQVSAQVSAQVMRACYGAHDAGWLSFYDFFQVTAGMADKARGLIAAAQECGWFWPFSDLCIVTDRPAEIHMQDRRPHRADGPAVRYTSGFSVYAVRGVRVPSEWVESRATIAPEEILKATNADQRAAGMEVIGWARAMKALKRKVINGDPDTDIGALIELRIPGLSRPGRFLQAVCPRNGLIVQGVPDTSPYDQAPITTAVAAQAFLAGLPGAAYQHPPIRT